MSLPVQISAIAVGFFSRATTGSAMSSSIEHDVPEPDNPGGGQTVGPEIVVDLADEPLGALTNALSGIAESRPRGLGGDVTAQLVQGTVLSFQSELRAARAAVSKAQAASETLATDLASSREENARITSELGGLKKQHAFSSLCMTAATLLAGTAVEAYKPGYEKVAFVCGGLAAVLTIGGWLIPNLTGRAK
ncbi:hypothetical protein [Stenotrophomonas sp.]|uniref:hypothetical protein n=1 Tax=Stenotrophomonas sp. TaxID=69392 RepID=UPI0028AC09DE|nr:hypothetical protein [Stenotrophomonas sp.]